VRLPVTVHRGRVDGREFRVLRPAPVPPHALVVDHSWHLDICLDAAAAEVLAALWLLAARSPRTLVHLPSRSNRMPDAPGAALPDDLGAPLDLVLLHHSLHFAPAGWKRLRARLDAGRPHTATLPGASVLAAAEQARETESTGDPGRRHHRENRDLFHQRVHAETLFMIGSAPVFRATARLFASIAAHSPGHVPRGRHDAHFCTEFHVNDGVLARPDARGLHVEHRDAQAWAAR
jgi:hypothetical protein